MNNVLHQIAYDAIAEVFSMTKINKQELLLKYPKLNEQKATFVTLKKDNNLRGCIGSLIANKSLLEDIISNAKSASFRDSRFDVLHKDELESLDIEISILTHPMQVIYTDINDLKSKIRINMDGVILQLDNNQSTFLPQVWESLNTFESFFQNLCQKAGCTQDCLSKTPLIYTYQVEKIKAP